MTCTEEQVTAVLILQLRTTADQWDVAEYGPYSPTKKQY